MNPAVLPAAAEDRRHTVRFHIDPASLDRTVSDITFRRTRLGVPLARKLAKAGHVVPDWRLALSCASVVAREGAGGRLLVCVTAPRPHVVPEGELNPERTITVEYVGGADDGWSEPLEMDSPIPPSLAISLHGSVFHRWAYDLASGVWLYRVRPPLEAHDPGAEVEDDTVWDDD